MLCDTGDGTSGGGKRLCEPESHILLSRSHDSLLIYLPLRLFFLLFFPLSIWLQPYEGSVCSPSEGNKDASVRASSGDGNVDRSFDPTCCTLTCMTKKTNVLIIIFFVCSDKKHKAIFSLASHWFSHSLSFYFPTFITFEVTNLIVLTLSILTVGRLRICKLMFKSLYKWTPVFTCTAGLELSNVWLSCCAKMWTTPREQKRKLSFISTMSFFGFSFIFGTRSSGKWWQFVPLQDFCIIHDAPWLPLNAEVNFH